LAERIIDENIVTQANKDLKTYAEAVCRERAIPHAVDGLKPVMRKILYTMYEYLRQTRSGNTVKSASIVGVVMQRFHPHGDSGIYGAMKGMTNWFESYMPLIKPKGSFGNIWGDDAAASRYTEAALTPYAVECILGDMTETYSSTDWDWNYDNTVMEPVYLPAKVPNLLINGSFGIAVGMTSNIPPHNISEVIGATIQLMDHPESDIILLPDDPQGCDIIEADFRTISRTGKGRFKTRAKIDIGEFQNKPALIVRALPHMVYFEDIKNKIEDLKEKNILPQVIDIYNNTVTDLRKKAAKSNFEVCIVLKKDTDPNYVRDILYKHTRLETTKSVNFEVVYNNNPVIWNYKQYLQHFIDFRIERKARMYNAKLKECKTRMHELDFYIKILKSGKIDQIIDKIRKQKTKDDEELINFMLKMVKDITPLQAKFILNVNIKKLSMGYLNEYIENYKILETKAKQYLDWSIHPEKLKTIIKDELIAINQKYGCPRRSRIISASEAEGIPEGMFKVVITESGFIKKIDVSDKSLSLRNDKAKFVLTANNTDSLLLFGSLAKVYKVPVHKIPFAAKNSNGIDMRIAVKKYSGEGIAAVIPESMLDIIDQSYKAENMEGSIITITRQGLAKRMNISELFNIPLSGLMYAKLNEGDVIADLLVVGSANEIIIYSHNKALRIWASDIPLLSRTTKGVIGMKSSKYAIDGMCCIVPNSTHIVVVTESGRVNKIGLESMERGTRARAGDTVIKLGKTDSIKYIGVCNETDTLSITTHRNSRLLPVAQIPTSSSISQGEKLVDSSGVASVFIIRS
jgi:DNA gyrase, A subunit